MTEALGSGQPNKEWIEMMATGKLSNGMPRLPEWYVGECEVGEYRCQGCGASHFNEETQQYDIHPGCDCPPEVRRGDVDLYESCGMDEDEDESEMEDEETDDDELGDDD